MSLNNKILLKRYNTSGVVPSVNSLSAGEVALNISDGKIFFKKIENSQERIIEFINSNDNPYILNTSLSSIKTQYGNNIADQVFSIVLGGFENKSSGAGSTVINGEGNEITSDFAFIGTGFNNKIHPTGDYSAILGGQNNLITHKNSFTIGSNLSSHAENFTYVNNLSATALYGNGSNSSNWGSVYTTTQTNSANWQTAYAYVSANSVNLTATNIFVNNNLTVTNTVSAKYYQGTLLDWMTLVRGYKTTPTLLATLGTGEVYTYIFATTGTDKTYYRYIATDGSEDSFYGNFTNPTLSNLIARKAIIL